MTVLIYVDTSKQVGDPDYLKVFANANAAGDLVRGKRPRRRCVSIRGFGMKVRGGFRKPRQAIKPVALHPRRSASRFFPQTLRLC